MADALPPPAVIVSIGSQVHIQQLCYVAGLTVCWFDYILTFEDEYRYIWKQKKTWLTWLFFVNRYFSLAASTAGLFLYVSPFIAGETCKKMAPFQPFGQAIPDLIVPSLLMTARVYALYGLNKKLAAGLILYLVVEVAMTLVTFLFPGAGPLILPPIDNPNFRVCSEVASPRLGNASIVWLALECGFDVIIVALTIWSSVRSVKLARSGVSLYHTLIRDGFLYFSVIFSANFAWLLMILTAPEGIKYTLAEIALGLVTVMVNRITLNLRAQGHRARMNEEETIAASQQSGLSNYKARNKLSTGATHQVSAISGSHADSITVGLNSFELSTLSKPEEGGRYNRRVYDL